MWQLLKVLWGKISGQVPSAPSKTLPVQQPSPSPQKAPALQEAPKPTSAAPKVIAAQRGEEPSQKPSPTSEAGESCLGPAQPTPTAKSISDLWAMSDSGSRISRLAATSSNGRAVSSIARAVGPIVDR